jgi:hypothetical protein
MSSGDSASPVTDKRQRRQTAKAARQADRAHAARRDRLQQFVFRGAAILLVVGVFGGLGWWVFRPRPGVYVPSQENAHVVGEAVGFRYASDPPTSGPHLSSAARWGIHGQPIPTALQVHNLEDGGVLIQYNCPDCDDMVSKLKDVVRRYPDKIILAPYPAMKYRIALTAWSYIENMDEFDEERIVRFIEAHRGIDHHAGNRFGI